MHWYFISAMVLLAWPVYVILTKRQAIADGTPSQIGVRVATSVASGGVSGLFFAFGMVPATGFSYSLAVFVSLLSAGSVCSMFMKYDELRLSTACHFGLLLGLGASLVVVSFCIPIYVGSRIEALLNENSSADNAAARFEQFGDLAIDPLIKVLANDDSNVRKVAAEALELLGQPEWLQYVRGDDDDFRRLGSCEDSRVAVPLIKALSNGKSTVRRSAAEALGLLGDKRAVDPLIKALWDDDTILRLEAVEALGLLDDGRAVDPLIKVLSDDDPDVREAAAKVLGLLGDKRALDSLTEASVMDSALPVRRAARKALKELGYKN